MNFRGDKEKMVLILVLTMAIVFLLGVFVGRISMHNIYYLG